MSGTVAPPRPVRRPIRTPGGWHDARDAVDPAGHYEDASTLAGPLRRQDRVRFQRVLTGRQRAVLALFVAWQLGAGVGFVTWLLWPSHLVPLLDQAPGAVLASGVAITLMVLIELVRLVQGSALWLFAARARDPRPMLARPDLRVAVLTTIVPDREPLDLVARTLRAMRRIKHPGPVDVWLLDEGDDPRVRDLCGRLGVHHFSRRGQERFNRDRGPFRARTKAGNHNAWRACHEAGYDVVAQMDPDHVPTPDFLVRTLGYFNDPDVAFVVAPQVYGNTGRSWIAHGGAVQAYVFHGVIQRGANGLGAPLLIGTNHLYRTEALRSVGGYQDSIIEDHLTAMALYATDNPATGRPHRGVYTPDVVAVGEGPTSFTDYFNQQKRWAYGIWEVMARHSPTLLPRMQRRQRLSFALLQMFYPSVALSWLAGNLAGALYLLGGATTAIPLVPWALLWTSSLSSTLATFFWLRRFNLVARERREWGLAGIGLLLLAAPVYVAAMAAYLCRRPLSYTVTAKGRKASVDRWSTFRPQFLWLVGAVALLGLAGRDSDAATGSVLWMSVTAATSATPLILHAVGVVRRRLRRAADEVVVDLDRRTGTDIPATTVPATAAVSPSP